MTSVVRCLTEQTSSVNTWDIVTSLYSALALIPSAWWLDWRTPPEQTMSLRQWSCSCPVPVQLCFVLWTPDIQATLADARYLHRCWQLERMCEIYPPSCHTPWGPHCLPPQSLLPSWSPACNQQLLLWQVKSSLWTLCHVTTTDYCH